ncbi:MAG: nuclear transport factor 2 family protein [Gemmatimonadota bacterium]|nr:nuclear transport factor 2 family protein [Gemmatimonadota bacterium]
MTAVEREIEAMVHRETRAWDTRDAEALVDLFHPDMVWPWPPDPDAHDPMEWVFGLGRHDRKRWKAAWQELFDTHELVHNRREIRRIEVTDEGDGGLAVVDIDTLWRRLEDGVEDRWRGRTCKVYTKVDGAWKLIMHTGVLRY